LYGFAADVQNCFLNIKLHPADQNLFRFLWTKEGEKEPTEYKFTSLIFGSKASPWISSTCLFRLLEKFEEKYPELVETVKRSIWVDDILLSADTAEDCREYIRKLEEILAEGSFKLAKFAASHAEVLQDLPEEKLLFPEDERQDSITRALGIDWHLGQDAIFIGRELEKAFEYEGLATKRTLARMVATIYDPLQILLPWKVGGNLLLRDIWEHHGKTAEEKGVLKSSKSLWKEELPPIFQTRIEEWKTDYVLAAKIKVPRCLRLPFDKVKMELWGFADASPEAFGAVIYLKTFYKREKPTSRFITARGKVNPPGRHTLPRCELMAAQFLAQW
jgi:hypothetical protein